MSSESFAAVPLDFKLYVEGIFVPMIRATITSTIGGPASANIHIIATDRSVEFEPRSSIHIFYLDHNELYGDDSIPARRGKPKYKLLFEGEYLGLGFQKNIQSRSTVLRCVDISNNFDYAYKFVLNGVNPIINAPINQLYTGGGPKATVKLDNPIVDSIARLVTGEDTIIDGVRKLIREVFGGSSENIKTNYFLTSVEQRFKISEKVYALSDEEVINLVSTKSILNLITRSLGHQKPNFRLTEMINLLLGYVQYQRSTILAPKYDGDNDTFRSFIFNPNIYFAPPPRCNVLFPDYITSLGYNDNFMQSPTRLFMQGTPFGIRSENLAAIMTASTYLAPSSLSSLLPTGGAGEFKPEANFHSILTPEEKIKGIVPVITSIGQPEYVSQVAADLEDNPEGQEARTARNYLISLAEYELDVRRAASRDINTITSGFNPEVVVGAPALILDPSFSFYGLLASVTHSFSAQQGEGAQTVYTIQLPRLVQIKLRPIVGLSDRASSVVDRISKLLTADGQLPEDQRVESFDFNDELEILSDEKADFRLIDLLTRISKASVNEREELSEYWFNLVNLGIFENLPAFPRWVNRKFKRVNAGDAYDELYGCGSIIDPIDGSIAYESMAQAASAILTEYQDSSDPYKFNLDYTKRVGIVDQDAFEEHYGLTPLEFNDSSYAAVGPFTSQRQAPVAAYTSELAESQAHLG